MTDRDWMDLALALAWSVKGSTSPNPAVGAVVVRGGEILGSGATEPPGRRHAEAVALAAAGGPAAGATLYVTLEPCCHAEKRTPPCTEAILRAGVRRVVSGVVDENLAVSGKGIALLRSRGVEVRVGVRERECRRINADFFKYARTGAPHVTLKYAMSADGKIAAAGGDSRWISSEASRRYARRARARFDAICVGAETLRADNPSLLPAAGPPRLRVVVTASGDLPADRAMFRDGHATLVAFPERAAKKISSLPESVERLALREGPGGVDLAALLSRLGQRQIISLLVEGGGELAASFVRAGAVDRVVAYVSTGLLGGRKAPTPVGGEGADRVARMLRLTDVRARSLGGDLVIEGETEKGRSCSGRA